MLGAGLGAVLGPIAAIKWLKPIVTGVGLGLGAWGTADSAIKGNYAQAAFRGVSTAFALLLVAAQKSNTSLEFENNGQTSFATGKEWMTYLSQKYSPENVEWASLTPQEAAQNPSVLQNLLPSQVRSALMQSGWVEGVMQRSQSNPGGGWTLTQKMPNGETGVYIQWHPGGGHHGPTPYWKISVSGAPTTRIFNKE